MSWECRGSSKRNESPKFYQIFEDTQYNSNFFLPDKIPLSFLLQRSSNMMEEREEGPGRRERKQTNEQTDNIQMVVHYQSLCFLVRTNLFVHNITILQ